MIDKNALLDDLQELLNQEVLGNTVSDVGIGIEIAMQRVMVAKDTTLNDMRDAIYEDAVAHGLWEEKDGPYHCADIIAKESIELIKEAEHLSIHIHGSIDYTSPRSNYAEELADVIISSLSVAGKLGIDIDAAVRRKMEINKARPWKHGKEVK